MALTDDLNKLAAEDVVYVTRKVGTNGATEVFRGRLRQALNADWVFNASTGQNGVVGLILGSEAQNSWSSSENPTTGLQITVTFTSLIIGIQFNDVIILTSVIPTDFAD